MSTSGSIDFTMTRDSIIKRALRIVGVLNQGDLPTAEQTIESSEALNVMIKGWQSEPNSINLWNVQWETAVPVASSEVTGTDGAIYTCIKDIAVSVAADQPITGESQSTSWIKTGSTGGAWANGAAYNAIGQVPVIDVLGITEAFWRQDETDITLKIISRDEFMRYSLKGTFGTPSMLYLDLSSLTSPQIFLLPVPDVVPSTDTGEILHYNAIKRLEDFDAGGNTPDFDVKWISALTYGLAEELAFEYQLPRKEKQDIAAKARMLLENAKNDSTENMGMKLSMRTK